MAWTYSGDPSKSDRDWVRWRIQDTDTSDKLQTDAEIDAALATYGNKRLAAAKVCETLAAKFARRVDVTMGKLRIAHSQRVGLFQSLAQELRSEVALYVSPWAGGISKASKESYQEDTDRVEPSFAIGMHDHPELGRQHAEESVGSTE